MVDIGYNQTAASFKYGIKNPKIVYIVITVCAIVWVLCFAAASIGQFYTMPYGEFIGQFKIYAIATAIFFAALSPVLVIYLRERTVIKKGIMRCLCADDAKLMTVVPFETSSIPRSMYKIGVKFSYGDSKVTMISRHYGYSKNYIGCKVRIVYSPSCDDEVVLKKEKLSRRGSTNFCGR